jgi:hypothetical protein
MAVENVGDLEDRIRTWSTSYSTVALEPEYIWELIDEVIDDVYDNFDPWMGFQYGSQARSATVHFMDNPLVPPPYDGGVLCTDTLVETGIEVPDNSEYLESFPFPVGLRKPLSLYYGTIADDNELTWQGWEEFRQKYKFQSGILGGIPLDYTTYGETFLVGNTPPFATTLHVWGVFRPARISSQGTTNLMITEASELLRLGVLSKLVDYNFEDPARAIAFERRYRSMRSALKARSRNVQNRVHRARSRRAGTTRTVNLGEGTDE